MVAAISEVPSKIHVLDLFCGDSLRLKQLAKRHPRKVFVGVDHVDLPVPSLGSLPSNLHFVRAHALDFLRSRLQPESVRYVNIDYGVHHLSTLPQRRELFSRIKHLLVPGGKLYVTTYNQVDVYTPASLIREAQEAGLKMTRQMPLLPKPNASQSTYVMRHARGRVVGQRPGFEPVEGAPSVPDSTRLIFTKPRG